MRLFGLLHIKLVFPLSPHKPSTSKSLRFRLGGISSLRLVDQLLSTALASLASTMAVITSRAALCVALLFVIACSGATEAAKIETFNGANCNGTPTNTFYVGGNRCQTFFDQSSVRVTEVSSGTRVSVHNQQNCQTYSSVGQFYGPGCLTQGATKLRAVWIQG